MNCFLFLASNSGLGPDDPSSREPSKTPIPSVSPRDQDSLEEQDKNCLVPGAVLGRGCKQGAAYLVVLKGGIVGGSSWGHLYCRGCRWLDVQTWRPLQERAGKATW